MAKCLVYCCSNVYLTTAVLYYCMAAAVRYNCTIVYIHASQAPSCIFLPSFRVDRASEAQTIIVLLGSGAMELGRQGTDLSETGTKKI